MKVCQFSSTFSGADLRLGILATDCVIDVNQVWQLHYESLNFFNAEKRALHHAPRLLHELLAIKERPLEFLKETESVYEKFLQRGTLSTKTRQPISIETKKNKVAMGLPLSEIQCYRDFYTHEKHVKKGFEKRGEPMPDSWYEMPVYYKGSTSGFIGTGETIPWPSFTKKLDYELELAAVIGRDGINIKEEKAFEHIFGFTILNDVSARDIQKKEMASRLGPSKGKDFCSVLGPVIVTADEFKGSDPDLEMQALINGELWSKGRSSEAHFSWAEMIAFCAQDEWVRATDVLGSGTVGTGCGLELDRWIRPGDTVELKIDKIGEISNTIGHPKTNL